MKCPHCSSDVAALVTETRTDIEGNVYRRRYCGKCDSHFVTKEVSSVDLKMPTKDQTKKKFRY